MRGSNKYPGKCYACGKMVAPNTGEIERIKGKWVVWHVHCFNESDNSSEEDRCCGNRAYEDACARAVGSEW